MNPDKCKNEECSNKEGYMLFGYCESCFYQTVDTLKLELSDLHQYDLTIKDSVVPKNIQGSRIA